MRALLHFAVRGCHFPPIATMTLARDHSHLLEILDQDGRQGAKSRHSNEFVRFSSPLCSRNCSNCRQSNRSNRQTAERLSTFPVSQAESPGLPPCRKAMTQASQVLQYGRLRGNQTPNEPLYSIAMGPAIRRFVSVRIQDSRSLIPQIRGEPSYAHYAIRLIPPTHLTPNP